MESETFGLTGIDFTSRLNKPSLLPKSSHDRHSISREVKGQSRTSRNEDAQKKDLFQTTSTFPSIHHNKKPILKSQILDQQSEFQSLKVLEKNDKKFEMLKTVLESMKNQKGDKLDKHALVSQYDNKLTERYQTLYEKEPREKVIKQLINLEKKQFLQFDLGYKELRNEMGKKKFNQIRYEVQKKYKYLENLNQQIKDIESLFPKTKLFEIQQQKKEEKKDIQRKIKTEKFNQQTLEFMVLTRKKILLFAKKNCTNLTDELQYVDIHSSVQSGHYQIRQNYKRNLISQYKFLDNEGELKNNFNDESFFLAKKEKLGKKFNEMMEDALSEFEETKALEKTLKHEQILENDRINQLEAQRQVIFFILKIFFQRLLNKKNSMSKIYNMKKYQKKKGNIKKKEKDSMQNIQQYLSSQIKEQNQIIVKYREKIKQIKFMTDKALQEQSREVKFDAYEEKLIMKNNQTQELENYISKLERTIDGICTVVGRVLYQLSNQKNKNSEVKREDLLNSVSACGLKLERMLTILQKRKNNFRIESINTDGAYKETPNFLGLNQKRVYEKIDDNEAFNQYFNDADINLVKRADSDDEFLSSQVEELKRKYELKSLSKVKDKDQNKSEKTIFSKLKGVKF